MFLYMLPLLPLKNYYIYIRNLFNSHIYFSVYIFTLIKGVCAKNGGTEVTPLKMAILWDL